MKNTNQNGQRYLGKDSKLTATDYNVTLTCYLNWYFIWFRRSNLKYTYHGKWKY